MGVLSRGVLSSLKCDEEPQPTNGRIKVSIIAWASLPESNEYHAQLTLVTKPIRYDSLARPPLQTGIRPTRLGFSYLSARRSIAFDDLVHFGNGRVYLRRYQVHMQACEHAGMSPQ